MNRETILIGFGHKRQSGKDTAFRVIRAMYENLIDVRRYAFADELRLEYKDMRACLAPEDKESERHGLQELGVQRRVTCGPNYWVDKVSRKVRRERPNLAVITDVRFPNEAGWLRGNGGLYIELDRTNISRNTPADNHISEHALDGVEPDICIVHGSQHELEAKIRRLFSKLSSVESIHRHIAASVTMLEKNLNSSHAN